jgi:hypothetical protein
LHINPLMKPSPNPSSSEPPILGCFDISKRIHRCPEPGNAEKFLSYGETPRNKDLPTPQLAALSFTMSTVLNLDETITRD